MSRRNSIVDRDDGVMNAFDYRFSPKMNVHFYLPEKYWPETARQEAWQAGEISTLEQSGKIACAQCWIYQTWAALHRAGVEVQLSSELPTSGVLVTLTGFFPEAFRPPKDVFFAGIVADSLPHPGAQVQILQNPLHAQRLRHSRAIYMPLWPQPNLLPRDPARGTQFENICFYGDEKNLAPELQNPHWRKRLEDLGVRLVLRSADQWHDYREADAIMAVRGFGGSSYLHKPGTKLYNAWLAGVPFIGGLDSAYVGDGRPGENFLQAASPESLFDQIRRLRDNPALRQRLVTAGHCAGKEFSPAATLERWKTLLSRDLPARAATWKNRSERSRGTFFFFQRGRFWRDRTFRH